MFKWNWWTHLLLVLATFVLMRLPGWFVFDNVHTCNKYCPYPSTPCVKQGHRWCQVAKCKICIDTTTLECYEAEEKCLDVYTTESVRPFVLWACYMWMISVLAAALFVRLAYPKKHAE